MRRGLWRDETGVTAVEFALVLPFLISLMFGGFGFAMAIWTQNILQDAAQEAARCIAQALSACQTTPTGCDSGSASVCYVETVAKNRGMTSLSANTVAITTSATLGGQAFTTVTINYPFSLSTYTFDVAASFTLTGYGTFPNTYAY